MQIDVSEERITSTFRVENQSSKKPAYSRWLGIFDSEDGSYCSSETSIHFQWAVRSEDRFLQISYSRLLGVGCLLGSNRVLSSQHLAEGTFLAQKCKK
jgi:hypothetical protein